ncbi:glycosyltransferase [Paenibacillus sp. FSL P2-0536]|uniref:glycosyltransferase family 2 protein n=1 Tax=Paenibacillus sp. FSL P2-0536 TaxID=2921629 RepID=UPI0030FBC9E7
MSLSCVILNYNDSETTVRLLQSIESFNIIDHIILVDNFSTDNSFDIFKKYENEKIHVIQTPKNGGYGYGNNYGVKYAYFELNSDYILIVNPDVEFSEKLVEELLDTMSKDPKCAVTSAVALTPTGKRQSIIAWKLPSIKDYVLTGSIVYSKLFSKMNYSDDFFNSKEICQVDCVPGSLLMVNAQKMISFGMYDEDIFLYCEETTLAHKFKKHDLKTLLLLNYSYIHRHSVSISKSIKSIKNRRKLILESRMIFLKKYYNVSNNKMVFIKVFFMLVLLENMTIYKLKGEV